MLASPWVPSPRYRPLGGPGREDWGPELCGCPECGCVPATRCEEGGEEKERKMKRDVGQKNRHRKKNADPTKRHPTNQTEKGRKIQEEGRAMTRVDSFPARKQSHWINGQRETKTKKKNEFVNRRASPFPSFQGARHQTEQTRRSPQQARDTGAQRITFSTCRWRNDGSFLSRQKKQSIKLKGPLNVLPGARHLTEQTGTPFTHRRGGWGHQKNAEEGVSPTRNVRGQFSL